ncbi:hypothetical protein F0357_04665 [Rhizobiales bacterium Sp-1]|uniref:Uncharacterized protein n=1 Tax=Segnochrobactrum spirostomi TaxID=2608987 RepID=A0A6A7Y2J6_9HYPH|nr:hypothetical protein [Segnochrobactrum spirostomi]
MPSAAAGRPRSAGRRTSRTPPRRAFRRADARASRPTARPRGRAARRRGVSIQPSEAICPSRVVETR